ncbi:MAG: hypothetical protein FWG85_08220 [Bacteroidetes bacterium]|nr:hypothetical protein [Bacteroidota bacterium]
MPRVFLPPRHLLSQMPPLHRSGTVPLPWRGSSALALRGGSKYTARGLAPVMLFSKKIKIWKFHFKNIFL